MGVIEKLIGNAEYWESKNKYEMRRILLKYILRFIVRSLSSKMYFSQQLIRNLINSLRKMVFVLKNVGI